LKPISFRLLRSRVSYYGVSGKDAYGNPSYGSAVAVSMVYVEQPKVNSLSSLGEQANDRLILYHDVRRSVPAGQSYVKGDRVDYDGETYHVRDAQLLPNPDQPHHWEVRLT